MTTHRIVRAAIPVLALPFLFASAASQGVPPATTQQPVAQVINASDDPLLAPFRFRSIGPASMGGRIDDVDVAPSDPNIIYIGYAVGGVWKSENNGTTWQPVFDTYSVASIGDIAIHPTDPNIVYVGTGEANNRQTSSFGDGIYKTVDGGKTFQHLAPDPPQGQQPGGFGGRGRGGVAPPVEPGTYLVTLTAGGRTMTKPLTVLQDRWVGER